MPQRVDKPFWFRVSRAWWRLLRRQPPGNRAGMCHWDIQAVELAPDLRGRELMAAAIHEAVHAAMGSEFDHGRVYRIDAVATDILWKLGFRQIGPHGGPYR